MTGEAYDPAEQRQFLAIVRIYEQLFRKRPESVLQLGCGTCIGISTLRARGIEAAGTESSPQLLSGPLDDNPYIVRPVGYRVPLATGSYDLVFSMRYLDRFGCEHVVGVVAEHLRLARHLVFIGLPGSDAGIDAPRSPCQRRIGWWRSLLHRLGAEVVGELPEGLLALAGRNRFTERRGAQSSRTPSAPVKAPSASIVIPCYNLAAYLPQTLESVRNQTRTDWEAVVVNDGSSDSTREVVRDFLRRRRDGRFRYVEQRNMGLPSARNTGIEHATGQFILPLDADDLLEPTFLEETVEVLETFPQFGIVYTHLRAFGSEQWEAACPPWHPCRLLQYNRLPYASLYRREVWESTGGYDPAMREGYEDWEFWVSAAERGWRGTCVPKKLFLYRRRPGSMLSRAYLVHEQLVARIHSKHGQFVADCLMGRAP